MKKGWFIFLLFILASCGDDDTSVSDTDLVIQEWLAQENVSNFGTIDETGIYFYPVTQNPAGASVSSGSVVSLYYRLFDLANNLVASYQASNGDALLAKQGASAIYPIGLDQALSVMRAGETYNFLLPPTRAYAQLNSGSLDGAAVYRLEIQLTGVANETLINQQELTAISDYIASNNLNDTIANPLDRVVQFGSGVGYKRLAAGTGSLPINGDTIIVNFSTRFLSGGGTVNSSSGFEFQFGSDLPRALFPGFAFGITLMQRQESALFLIPSSQAYRESALVVPGSITNELIEENIIPDYVSSITPYQPLIFNVTRIN